MRLNRMLPIVLFSVWASIIMLLYVHYLLCRGGICLQLPF